MKFIIITKWQRFCLNEECQKNRENKRKERKESEEHKESKKKYNKKYRKTSQGRASKLKSKALRRSRKRTTAIESIDPMDICERDGWKCYLCGIETPKYLRGTHKDNAPEIDHIISLANGGSHTKDNVACSCRRCNNKKGKGSNHQAKKIIKTNTWGGLCL